MDFLLTQVSPLLLIFRHSDLDEVVVCRRPVGRGVLCATRRPLSLVNLVFVVLDVKELWKNSDLKLGNPFTHLKTHCMLCKFTGMSGTKWYYNCTKYVLGPQESTHLHCGVSTQSQCFAMFFLSSGYQLGWHSSCSISPTAGETCRKLSAKYHNWGDAPHCTGRPMSS